MSAQSTTRRPSSRCRCFGVADRMRVPRPAAMTTPARLRGIRGVRILAGAPGFEPGIAGPKPAALPLGYAPIIRLSEYRSRSPIVRPRRSVAFRKQRDEREDGDDADRDQGERPDDLDE